MTHFALFKFTFGASKSTEFQIVIFIAVFSLKPESVMNYTAIQRDEIFHNRKGTAFLFSNLFLTF